MRMHTPGMDSHFIPCSTPLPWGNAHQTLDGDPLHVLMASILTTGADIGLPPTAGAVSTSLLLVPTTQGSVGPDRGTMQAADLLPAVSALLRGLSVPATVVPDDQVRLQSRLCDWQRAADCAHGPCERVVGDNAVTHAYRQELSGLTYWRWHGGCGFSERVTFAKQA